MYLITYFQFLDNITILPNGQIYLIPLSQMVLIRIFYFYKIINTQIMEEMTLPKFGL